MPIVWERIIKMKVSSGWDHIEFIHETKEDKELLRKLQDSITENNTQSSEIQVDNKGNLEICTYF